LSVLSLQRTILSQIYKHTQEYTVHTFIKEVQYLFISSRSWFLRSDWISTLQRTTPQRL